MHDVAFMFHLNWGHAPAHRLTRILVDAEGAKQRLLDCVGEVVRQREVCRAFERAPHLPSAGTSSASSLSVKIQVDRLFLDDATVLRTIDMCSKHSALDRPCPKNPLEVRDAFAGSRSAAFGRPGRFR